METLYVLQVSVNFVLSVKNTPYPSLHKEKSLLRKSIIRLLKHVKLTSFRIGQRFLLLLPT